jgi:hypothetical protein
MALSAAMSALSLSAVAPARLSARLQTPAPLSRSAGCAPRAAALRVQATAAEVRAGVARWPRERRLQRAGLPRRLPRGGAFARARERPRHGQGLRAAA